MDSNFNGTYLCTASNDKSLKIFDVVNFDMINMMKLDYVPLTSTFIHSERDPISAICV
jgi:peptidylprolyl isomerase domain and WD repeat-containing protein 1